MVYYREMERTDVVPSTFSPLRVPQVGNSALFLLLLLGGCGEDPILTKAREAEEAARAKQPAGSPPGSPSSGGVQPGAGRPENPRPGVPEQPKPGVPDQPSPGGSPGAPTPGTPGPPGEGIPSPPAPGSSFSGPRVEISGTVEFPAYKGGMVRVSAFDGAHAEHAGTQPKIVGEVRLDGPGPFSLAVPQEVKNVYLEAAVDEDGNGRPGPLEPQGSADRYPVSVSGGGQSGILILLSRREPPPGAPPKEDF